jgi:hypothetical protein
MLTLRRWRPSHLLLAWTTYWAGLAVVGLGGALRAANRLAGPGQHGNASLGFGDGAFKVTITSGTETLWNGAVSATTLALWLAGPPLLLWVVWLATRPHQHAADTEHPMKLRHPDARPIGLPDAAPTDFVARGESAPETRVRHESEH